MPHPDDPTVDAVGSKLLEVRSKKKKKQVEGLVIKPSVRDHGLSTLGIVELEEWQQRRVDESPPCNPMNAPHHEVLLQPMTKWKRLLVIGLNLELMGKGQEHLVDCWLIPRKRR